MNSISEFNSASIATRSISEAAEGRISKIILDWMKEIVVAIGFTAISFEYLHGKTFGNLNPDVTLWFLIVAPIAWISIATYIAGSTLARRYHLAKHREKLTSIVSHQAVGWVIFTSLIFCLITTFLIFAGSVLSPIDKNINQHMYDSILTIFVRNSPAASTVIPKHSPDATIIINNLYINAISASRPHSQTSKKPKNSTMRYKSCIFLRRTKSGPL
jgi:hypothetical protein